MADTDRVRIDSLLGYNRLITPPFRYGEQPPPAVMERFDRTGRLIERRVVPPVIRIVYGD
jgi:hypothetical protein